MMTARRFLFLLLLGGLLLSACIGGNKSDEKAAAVVKQVLQVGQGTDADIDVYVNKLPPGMPAGIPIYQGARIISSFRILDETGESFFILAETKDDLTKMLAFYEEQMDKDPWQVQGATNADTVTALRFTNTNDVGLEGTIAAHKGKEKGEVNSIMVTVQRSGTGKEQRRELFTLGESKPLPRGFPQSVPIYANATVTSTTWLRRLGNIDFSVTYLTKDPQDKVIEFYKAQLPKGGWKVTGTTDDGADIILNFEDEKDAQLGGVISATVFDKDSSYTEISVRVRTKSTVRNQ